MLFYGSDCQPALKCVMVVATQAGDFLCKLSLIFQDTIATALGVGRRVSLRIICKFFVKISVVLRFGLSDHTEMCDGCCDSSGELGSDFCFWSGVVCGLEFPLSTSGSRLV